MNPRCFMTSENNIKPCFVYEWNRKKFHISITSDDINISSAILDQNVESNILKKIKPES